MKKNVQVTLQLYFGFYAKQIQLERKLLTNYFSFILMEDDLLLACMNLGNVCKALALCAEVSDK
jgi:hypothetical protein